MTARTANIASFLDEFRKTGDVAALIENLSDGQANANPLLVLQHGIQCADSAEVRERLDDIAWAVAQGETVRNHASEADLDDIEKAAVKSYGRLIRDAVPNLRELAAALLSEPEPPPRNAVVAAIGHQAEKQCEVFRIDSDSFGEESRFFSTSCSDCGGEEGGAGYVVCSACVKRARLNFAKKILREKVMEDIGKMPSAKRNQIDASATLAAILADVRKHVDVDQIPNSMVAAFVRENPSEYGCSQCHQEPVRDCTCAKKVRVPQRLFDGQIVSGTRPATGESFCAVLRLSKKQ